MITRFHAGDEFKIIMDNDQQITWYPDGEMTIVDATLIQRFEIGMSVKYPINEFV